MTRADIASKIASATGLSKVETEAVVEGFILCVIEALKENESIEIRGFGTFKVKERQPRTARNPKTGAKVELARRFVPMFKVSKEFKKAVNDSLTEKYNNREINK
ncbi:MAG: integration host factor subunit beta [Ignavibacteria bacterium]|nr:integration host factor subunit beta [Ignavibacteria bacterium]